MNIKWFTWFPLRIILGVSSDQQLCKYVQLQLTHLIAGMVIPIHFTVEHANLMGRSW